MKKIFALSLAIAMALTLAACGTSAPAASASASASAGSAAAASGSAAASTSQPVTLTVFAAASMTETLNKIAEQYKTVAPNVTLSFTFDSSGILKSQIQEGADCDLFISAAQKQMNQLDGSLKGDADKNPDGLDMINTATRINLLENKVTLVVPKNNPKNITGFDQLSKMLSDGSVLMAMGNSDVPVGQYTEKILAYYKLDEAALAKSGVLTYGSNVKEVTTQVSEGAVDCGVIYATDAYSAGLTVVDTATAAMCGQAIYPAAVLKAAKQPDAAKAFLAYLQTEPAMQVFQTVGFSPAG